MTRSLTPFPDDRASSLRKLSAFWQRQAQAYTDQEQPDLASAAVCRKEWAIADIELSLELGRVGQ